MALAPYFLLDLVLEVVERGVDGIWDIETRERESKTEPDSPAMMVSDSPP